MLVPGQTPNSIQDEHRSWWICIVATLTISLWASNFLPIQTLQYRLTTNLAVSKHRIPMLEKLLQSNNANGSLPFSIIAIQPAENNDTAPPNSDLRTMRLILSLARRSETRDIERTLDELTIPTMPDKECVELTKQVRNQKWIIESMQHSLKRLELDEDRARKAIVIDSSENADSVASESTVKVTAGPFRLSSYSSQNSKAIHDSQSVRTELQAYSDLQSEKLADLMVHLERMNERAKGFLSLTGAPKLEPIVRPITIGRFLILCTLSGTVWLICMAWVSPLRGMVKSWEFGNSSVKPDVALNAGKERKWEQQQILQWIAKAGVAHLGRIQHASVSEENSETQPGVSPEQTAISPSRSVDTLILLKKMTQYAMILWLGLFVGRTLFDPAWRELGFLSPLGAISRMIFGIP